MFVKVKDKQHTAYIPYHRLYGIFHTEADKIEVHYEGQLGDRMKYVIDKCCNKEQYEQVIEFLEENS